MGETTPRVRPSWQLLVGAAGPAFVVSVAYIDPGNFATNFAAGSRFGYALLWVVLWSNIMAIVIQSQSARLGIATGQDLATVCRRYWSRPWAWLLWVVAEVAAMATDLAEFLGATLGIQLLSGCRALPAALVAALLVLAVLHLQQFGYRPLEVAITSFVGAVGLAYVLELAWAAPDWRAAALGALLPRLPGGGLFLAAGILGATVMPHVVFLHSDLVQARRDRPGSPPPPVQYRLEVADIVTAMNVAALVNGAMVVMAAAVFWRRGLAVEGLATAHQTLGPLLGPLSGTVFAVALLASGLSSAVVGTMAGQVVMQGFLDRTVPIWQRRAVTMLPALVVLASGANVMTVMVASQVVLSLALPFAVVPLAILVGRADVMGPLVARRRTLLTTWLVVAVIATLNVALLAQLAGL